MDALLTVQRLANAVDQQFGGSIDLSDLQKQSPEEIRRTFLSRALAAFCIVSLTNCDAKEAAASITDGFNDQGIDAIYFDSGDKALYLVQSKWSQSGSSTIDQGDMEKFLRGIRALMSPDFSQFNDKVCKRRDEIVNNLLMRSDVRVILVLAYTSSSPLGVQVSGPLTTFIKEQNNIGDPEVFSTEVCGLKRLYGYLSGQDSGKINQVVSLRSWGTIATPYRAYYGQVLVSEIASWAVHGRLLFAKNLRYFRGDTPINQSIDRTLTDNPDAFWYFNNGITMLANSVHKTLIAGSKTDFGTFDCKGVNIVNGAQTVGVIWDLAKRLDEAAISAIEARVQARIIDLSACPEGFGTEVTRAANTQNPIRHRDYAALDPEQQRLANEMQMDKRRYAYKSGDIEPKGPEGCNIEEATVALACANDDVGMAVQAKREVGQLWQDIRKPPYTTLFNSELTATTMWRAVLVLRAVEDQLKTVDKNSVPRGELVAVHGNRFILHKVFMHPAIRDGYRDPHKLEAELTATAKELVAPIFEDVARSVESLYPNAYLANLFKNAQKNKDLEVALCAEPEEIEENLALDFGQ